MRPLVFGKSLTVRTDAGLRAAIEAAAAEDGASASCWVRRAIARAVEQGGPARPGAPSDDRRAA